MQFNKTLVCVVCLCGMGLLLQSWMPGVAMGAPQSDEDSFGAEAKPGRDVAADAELPPQRVEFERSAPPAKPTLDGESFGSSSLGKPSDGDSFYESNSSKEVSGKTFRPSQAGRWQQLRPGEAMNPVSVIDPWAMPQRQLLAAFHALKSAKDDSARTTAKAKVRTQLQTQFDLDLKRREEELKKVEERVKALREQFEKRKSAQASIVDLRLQTLVNEANGLGFPGGSMFDAPMRDFMPSNARTYDDSGSDLSRQDPFDRRGGFPVEDRRGPRWKLEDRESASSENWRMQRLKMDKPAPEFPSEESTDQEFDDDLDRESGSNR